MLTVRMCKCTFVFYWGALSLGMLRLAEATDYYVVRAVK